jgi:hypothetical protein
MLNDSGPLIATMHPTAPQRVGTDNIVVVLLAGEYLKKGNYFLRVTQPPSIKLLYSFKISS